MSDQLTDQQAIGYGRNALLAYQNILVDWYGSKYSGSYETLLNAVQNINSDWLKQVGYAVWRSKLGDRRMHEAIERVIDKHGMTPVGFYEFNQGLIEEVKSFDFSLFSDAAIDLAKSTGKVIENTVDAVSDVSKGAIDSVSFLGKNLKWIVAIVVALLIFIGFKIVRKKADI